MKLCKALFALFAIQVFVSGSVAIGQTDLSIRGSGKLYPIALPQLCLEEGESSAVKEIPDIVTRDLSLSGYFEVLNPSAFLETPGKCSQSTDSFAYSDWSVIGAEGLVKGIVEEDDGQLKVKIYLHDVQGQRIVLGKEYEGHRTQIATIAHRFANEIMRFFTGESGVFGSQIAFSSKVGRFKELFVMDMNGTNIRQLTNEKGLALYSSWDAAGDILVYTSYRQRVPDLFLLDIFDKRSKRVTRGSGLEIGGQFGPDGKSILAAQTFGKESHIVLFDLEGRIKRRITSLPGVIDVSPKWSPSFSKIVFCSNRSGGPQIFTMNSDGTDVKRVSFVRSNYCTSPAWSPLGDRIAYVCRVEGRHHIFSSRVDGTDSLQLTSVGNNENPEWSPNGKYLAFSSTFGHGQTYNIALMRYDGTSMKQLTNSKSGDFDPAWGPLPGS